MKEHDPPPVLPDPIAGKHRSGSAREKPQVHFLVIAGHGRHRSWVIAACATDSGHAVTFRYRLGALAAT